MYGMESVTNRILIKKQIADERSKRTKSYVTTLLLSLALGICLIGFMIFLTFYSLCPPPPPNQTTAAVLAWRMGIG